MKIGFPLRYQITGLLFVFVGATAFVSGRTVLSFISEDKVRSMRDMQVLWAGQSAQESAERLLRARRQLEGTSRELLNGTAISKVPDEKTWRWIRVGERFWRAPNFQGAMEAPAVSPEATTLQPLPPNQLLLSVPLVLDEAGQERRVAAQGLFESNEVFPIAEDLERGLLKGLVVDLRVGAKPDAMPPVVVGTEISKSRFESLWDRLDAEDREALRKPGGRASVRVIPFGDDEMVFAWAPVSTAGAGDFAVLSFITRDEILQGFRRTFYELAFYAFLLFGFGFLASRWLSGRLSTPIEQMAHAASLLETGDFSVRVDPGERRDEVGQLAEAFNHMGQALEDREVALKSAQEALVQSEKLAAVGTLSAGLAHEVKNPLAGILSNADLAMGQLKKLSVPTESPIYRYIEVVRKETARCRGIIDSLMRFSREEKAEMKDIDLELVTWEAINLMEHTLNMAQVRVEKDFGVELNMIRGNANQVEQVLLNMMQNAGHAMTEGGSIFLKTDLFQDPAAAPVGRYLAYRSEQFQGAFCRIMIKDTGVGMTDEVQRKIFEPFFTTKPRGQGTGLGLAVTMGIIAEHQARVSIDSAPGQGTTFYIDFMARGPRTAEVQKELEEMRHRRSGGAKLSTDVAASKPAPAAAPDASAVVELELPAAEPSAPDAWVDKPTQLNAPPAAPPLEVATSDFDGLGEAAPALPVAPPPAPSSMPKPPPPRVVAPPASGPSAPGLPNFQVRKPKVK